jgi:hypothetical protein
MNKKLITLAVAAALAAPAAAMAEATLYGKLHVSIDYVDVDEFANWGAVPTAGGEPNLVAGTEAFGEALQFGTVDPYDFDIYDGVDVTAPVVFSDGTTLTIYTIDQTTGDLVKTDSVDVSGLNVWDTAYDSARAFAISKGYRSGIADVYATKEAFIAAADLASDEQLAAAYREAILFGRGQKFHGWTLDGNARPAASVSRAPRTSATG